VSTNVYCTLELFPLAPLAVLAPPQLLNACMMASRRGPVMAESIQTGTGAPCVQPFLLTGGVFELSQT